MPLVQRSNRARVYGTCLASLHSETADAAGVNRGIVVLCDHEFMSDHQKFDWLVCALDEIPDPGARGVSITTGDEWSFEAFVVRQGEKVYGYVNVCPHAGRSLNWGPDAFLTKDRSLIMCSAHGALFDPETGLCVAGPCLGASLRRISVKVVNGRIVLHGLPERPSPGQPGETGDHST